jgi:hypothetical protein
MRLMRFRRALAVAGATAIAAGLGLPSAASAQGSTVSGTLSSTVSLQVVLPTPGEVVTTPTLPIQVIAQGYRLDARYAGTPDLADVGHYHEIIDGHLIDMTPYRDGNRDQIPMRGLAVGPHMLTIVPANNDHSMVMSAAVTVPFTYAGPYIPMPAPSTYPGPPTITITAPADGATVQGDSFSMSAAVSNLQLSGDCFGKANVDGVGHWHIFLDQPMMANMLTMAGGTTQMVSLMGVTPGWHTFWAVLVNDQHMPFMGVMTTMAAVHLFVTSSA